MTMPIRVSCTQGKCRAHQWTYRLFWPGTHSLQAHVHIKGPRCGTGLPVPLALPARWLGLDALLTQEQHHRGSVCFCMGPVGHACNEPG